MAEVSAPIAAILNCYAPATGRNAAQIIVRSDGKAEIRGDDHDLARRTLRSLFASEIPAPTAPAVPWRFGSCTRPCK